MLPTSAEVLLSFEISETEYILITAKTTKEEQGVVSKATVNLASGFYADSRDNKETTQELRDGYIRWWEKRGQQ